MFLEMFLENVQKRIPEGKGRTMVEDEATIGLSRRAGMFAGLALGTGAATLVFFSLSWWPVAVALPLVGSLAIGWYLDGRRARGWRRRYDRSRIYYNGAIVAKKALATAFQLAAALLLLAWITQLRSMF